MIGLARLAPQELDGILVGLDQGESFVEKFLPPTPGQDSGIIKKISAAANFGLPQFDPALETGDSVKRGPETVFVDVPYSCQPYAWEQSVRWQDAKRVDSFINLQQHAAQVALDVIKTKRDVAVASLLGSASWGYTNTVAAGDRWTASTSNPIAQILDLKRRLRPGRGNALLLAQDAWVEFQTNDAVLNAMNTSADHAFADEDWFAAQVAKRMGVSRVVVVDSMYNSSANIASQTLAELFSGKALLVQVADAGVGSSNGKITSNPSALIRVVEEAPSLHEYDEDNNRTRVMQAHMSEITVVVDTRLGARLDGLLG